MFGLKKMFVDHCYYKILIFPDSIQQVYFLFLFILIASNQSSNIFRLIDNILGSGQLFWLDFYFDVGNNRFGIGLFFVFR